jgi:ligand-binding sensor domain-containing protein/signal transduction histidine kinase
MTERKAGNYLASVLFLLSASVIAPVAARAERLPIRSYTTADGLAGDRVTRILQDSRGFLWFCTTEGLSRFDGYAFINYGVDQGLPTRHVNDFLESRNGDYWIATDQGLCLFRPNPRVESDQRSGQQSSSRFVVYYPGDSLGQLTVNAICEDRAGTIWCGTSAGVYRLDLINGEWSFSFVDVIPRSQIDESLLVKSIIEDSRGTLWITSRSGLFRRWPDGRVEGYALKEGLPVREFSGALLEDRDGRIWVGSRVGLYQLIRDPKPSRSVVARVYTAKDGLPYGIATSLFQASDGRLWVGGPFGMSVLLESLDGKKNGRTFQTYTRANGLSDSAAGVMAEDRDRNLWIGTETGGAMKLAVNGFTTHTEADGLGSTRIQSIFENRVGELCVISQFTAAFLNKFEGDRFNAVRLTLPKDITYWGWGWHQLMLQSRTGEWWMPTGNGLVRYPRLEAVQLLTHAHPKAVYTTRDGLTGDLIFRLFEDSRGDVWNGTINRLQDGLTRWDQATERFHRYSPAEGVPQDAPTAFCEDGVKTLWVGFYHGGIARYRNNRFTFFTAEDGVPRGLIQSIHLDRAGRLWIASGEGGVARVDDPAADRPRFAYYTTAEGLSSNHTTCLTEDQWGRMYIGTGRGVNRLDPATNHVKQYTTADGLANNFILVAFRDHGGALWFGTLQGLSRLVPQPDRPSSPPPILITALRHAGISFPVSELGARELIGPKLRASENQIEIDFVGVSLAPGEMLRYQYKLEGADENWSLPTYQRTINYANLSPGSYRFAVRAVSAEGVASLEPAFISFTILPPLWQRWWFLMIGAVAIGLAVYGAHRYRVARLIELERIRTRIATDLHDDLGSNLSQIAILSEVARDEVAKSGAERQLSTIARIARESVDSMSDIVWAINPQRDWLEDLAGRMRRLAGEILPARGIEFHFIAALPDRGIKLGADIRRQLFLIFKEAVNNIARHSKASNVNITLNVEGSRLVMTLSDDGVGFNPASVKRGQGLASMKRRAESLGGELRLYTELGNGTSLTLRTPLPRRALISRGIGVNS